MTIAPLTNTGAAGLTGMLNMPAPAAKDGEKGDFMQTFQDAKNAQTAQQPVKTEGTGAEGKESEKDDAPAERPAEKKDNVRTEEKREVRNEKTEKPAEDKAAKTEEPREAAEVPADTPVDEIVMETIAANVQQLLSDILTLLGGIDMEELTDTFAQLGLNGEDLLKAGSGNILVANILGEGDITALLTDSELSDIAGKLNELIGDAAEEIRELLPDEEPARVMAPVLNEELKPAEHEERAAESVEELYSDAILPAGETAGRESFGMNGEMQQQTGENTEEKPETERKERTVRTEHSTFREEQPVFAPETVSADTNAIDPEALRAETEQLRYTTDPGQILDQVTDQIKTQVKDDVSSLEMVLHPASLGNVALNLTSKDGAVTAQFTAQSEAVKEALESQLVVLRQNLEQAGVKVTAVEVTVSSHAFEQNLEQGNDGQSDAEAKEQERLRRATRKIDLGAFGEEGEAEVDEADAVTVEMMQADGNRMDYKA